MTIEFHYGFNRERNTTKHPAQPTSKATTTDRQRQCLGDWYSLASSPWKAGVRTMQPSWLTRQILDDVLMQLRSADATKHQGQRHKPGRNRQ